MTRTRQQRIADFDTFLQKAEERFTALQKEDGRVQMLNVMYRLYCNVGSPTVDHPPRVDVHYGKHQADTYISNGEWQSVTEEGASLIISRDENGHVVVMLFPAHTANRKPHETCLILNRQIDPRELLSDSTVGSMWNDFQAYMEVTCLEGAPSRAQRFRVFWLRYSRSLVMDTKAIASTLETHAREIPKYVATIGLSGFLIYLFAPDPSRGSIEELQSISSKLDSISRRIPSNETAAHDIGRILTITDSIRVISSKTNGAMLRIEENTRTKAATKK